MPYLIILLIVGIIAIIISLKTERNSENNFKENNNLLENDNSNNLFKDYLNRDEILNKIDMLSENIENINQKMDEVESSLIIIGESIKNSEKDSNKKNDTYSKNNNNLNESIYSMIDKGCSIEDICNSLSIGKGEVELRIGLRK